MTPEAWTVLAVGVGLAALGVSLATFGWIAFGRLDDKFTKLDDRVRNHGERLSRIETILEDLRDAITIIPGASVKTRTRHD